MFIDFWLIFSTNGSKLVEIFMVNHFNVQLKAKFPRIKSKYYLIIETFFYEVLNNGP